MGITNRGVQEAPCPVGYRTAGAIVVLDDDGPGLAGDEEPGSADDVDELVVIGSPVESGPGDIPHPR